MKKAKLPGGPHDGRARDPRIKAQKPYNAPKGSQVQGKLTNLTQDDIRRAVQTQVARSQRKIESTIRDTISTVMNNGWFSPQQPVAPVGIPPDEPNVRLWDYPAGYNVNWQPRKFEAFSFQQLLWISQNEPLVGSIIERRKNEIMTAAWDLNDDTDTVSQQETDQIEAFLEYPDRVHPFGTWLRMLLHAMYTIDAACVHITRARDGSPYSLDIVDGSCYSDDTEVLTKRGWLKWPEVNWRDAFATRNSVTRAFEWQEPYAYFKRYWDSERDGDLINFSSRRLDLLVTPNHRMLVSQRSRSADELFEHEQLMPAATLAERGAGNWTIPVTSIWQAPDVPDVEILATPFSYRGRKPQTFRCSGDDFAALLGAYLAEGCANHSPNVCVISQSPEGRGYKEYRELLIRLFGYEPSYNRERGWVLSSKALNDYVSQFGYAWQKYIPDLIKGMSARQLEIFWHFYWLGDGDAEEDVISTTSYRMASDLQEVAQKIGRCANIYLHRESVPKTHPVWCVYASRNRYHRPTASRSTAYRGYVYCVSVPNEILYVRRNGRAAWCGNTITPLVDESGKLPEPPNPSYLQVIHGTPYSLLVQPDGTLTALDEKGKQLPTNSATSNDLIYFPRNPRPHSPLYGYSQLEIAITAVAITMKLEQSSLYYFTKGSIPDALLSVPDTWSSKQVTSFQGYFDSMLRGNLERRSGSIMFIPAGIKEAMVKKYDFSRDQWEWWARVLCAVYQVSSMPYVNLINRATADTAQVTQQEEGTKPDQVWVSDLMNRILRTAFGTRLKFTYQDQERFDPDKQAAADQIDIRNGVKTVAEVRGERGYDPYDEGIGDKPIFVTTAGAMLLQDVEDQSAAATQSAQAGAELAAHPPQVQASPSENGKPSANGKAPEPAPTNGNGKPSPEAAQAAKKLLAFGGAHKLIKQGDYSYLVTNDYLVPVRGPDGQRLL